MFSCAGIIAQAPGKRRPQSSCRGMSFFLELQRLTQNLESLLKDVADGQIPLKGRISKCGVPIASAEASTVAASVKLQTSIQPYPQGGDKRESYSTRSDNSSRGDNIPPGWGREKKSGLPRQAKPILLSSWEQIGVKGL